MNVPIQRIERMIGWLTFGVGISSIQRNESILYRSFILIAPIPAWIALYCGLGILMIIATYAKNWRVRLIIVLLLLLLWGASLAMIAMSGPVGPIGGYGTVIVCYLIWLTFRYIKGEGHADDS